MSTSGGKGVDNTMNDRAKPCVITSNIDKVSDPQQHRVVSATLSSNNETKSKSNETASDLLAHFQETYGRAVSSSRADNVSLSSSSGSDVPDEAEVDDVEDDLDDLDDDDYDDTNAWEMISSVYLPMFVQMFLKISQLLRTFFASYFLPILVTYITIPSWIKQHESWKDFLLVFLGAGQNVNAVSDLHKGRHHAAWPPPALVLLAILTVVALIVHPDGFTWVLLRKLRDSILSLLRSSATFWSIVFNDYGTIVSTILALSTFASLFFFAYVLKRTLTKKRRQMNIKNQKQQSPSSKKKKRKGAHHSNQRTRGGSSSIHRHGRTDRAATSPVGVCNNSNNTGTINVNSNSCINSSLEISDEQQQQQTQQHTTAPQNVLTTPELSPTTKNQYTLPVYDDHSCYPDTKYTLETNRTVDIPQQSSCLPALCEEEPLSPPRLHSGNIIDYPLESRPFHVRTVSSSTVDTTTTLLSADDQSYESVSDRPKPNTSFSLVKSKATNSETKNELKDFNRKPSGRRNKKKCDRVGRVARSKNRAISSSTLPPPPCANNWHAAETNDIHANPPQSSSLPLSPSYHQSSLTLGNSCQTNSQFGTQQLDVTSKNSLLQQKPVSLVCNNFDYDYAAEVAQKTTEQGSLLTQLICPQNLPLNDHQIGMSSEFFLTKATCCPSSLGMVSDTQRNETRPFTPSSLSFGNNGAYDNFYGIADNGITLQTPPHQFVSLLDTPYASPGSGNIVDPPALFTANYNPFWEASTTATTLPDSLESFRMLQPPPGLSPEHFRVPLAQEVHTPSHNGSMLAKSSLCSFDVLNGTVGRNFLTNDYQNYQHLQQDNQPYHSLSLPPDGGATSLFQPSEYVAPGILASPGDYCDSLFEPASTYEDLRIEAELQELGGQMVGSILDC